ncbi:hypothetical protein SAMN05421773_103287 [Streptomyces aidingensis]|uniref:PknH-like extracellular domain-containing protein n=1 Tax=Streptomyces aidingensis TaxID=910347 RepID=A0A1I1JDE2_9ACTN|nr:hypothetical protein SAMN05421773_103287 [Streptomyces aidingensis]
MTFRRAGGRLRPRAVAAVALSLLLTAACTAGADDGAPADPESPAAESEPEPEPEETGGGGPGADGAYDFVLDPAKAPATAAEAAGLVDRVAPAPENFGPGYVVRDPAEDDPGEWAVLGEDCVWRRAPVPDGVLASLTRYTELPAADGRGAVQAAMVITVHRDVRGAQWEMARTIEDAQRCPEQQLRQNEWVRGLTSMGQERGTLGNRTTEDALQEFGEFYPDAAGPYPYHWFRIRIGPVTVAFSAKGGAGRTQEEVTEGPLNALVDTTTRLEAELGAEEAATGGGEDDA